MMKVKLFPYKLERYSQELIDKYKSSENMLKHARYDKGITKGFFLIERKTDKLIGYIAFEKGMIIALEITKDFQHKGFAKKLLEFAVNHGANKLTVNKSNTNAIEMYKHLGWKRYKSTEKMLFLRERLEEWNSNVFFFFPRRR